MKKSKTSRSSRTESRCLIRSLCFTSYSFGLHDRSSYMPGCWCWCGVGLFCCLVLFPTLPCGVLVFFLHLLAPPPPPPPPSSFLLLSHTNHLSHNITHATSLTQHLSHNISHNNISHTTSLTQHPTHNISHTTSLTQHLSQQHLTHNITHATSHTQHLARNITHATSPTTQHLRPVPFACCVRRLLLAKGSDVCPGVVWRRLGTGALPVFDSVCLLCAALAACQGVGCTPWRRLASAGHRRSAGSLCVLCAALAACQGVGCTPWRAVCGACCLPRGRMYALASSGVGWALALCR